MDAQLKMSAGGPSPAGGADSKIPDHLAPHSVEAVKHDEGKNDVEHEVSEPEISMDNSDECKELQQAVQGTVMASVSSKRLPTRLEALKSLQLERIELALAHLERVSAAEEEHARAVAALHVREQEALAGAGTAFADAPLADFWPTVLRLAAPPPLSELDLDALAFLRDVRAHYLRPDVAQLRAALRCGGATAALGPGVRVELDFAPNEFFSAATLSLSVRFDFEDPACALWVEASPVRWKPGSRLAAWRRAAVPELDGEVGSLFAMLDFFSGGREVTLESASPGELALMVDNALLFVNHMQRRVVPYAPLIYSGEMPADVDADSDGERREEDPDWHTGPPTF
eukprot:gnl/Chilomastix_cuspidata/1803.p1 GENE.gnl/Chilomastix_cuspidata/1803~~gnl/Chilomastix_cuspidata/1803.p1  ORF type:complete len:343 (-),score=110.49 gnl/Chilomastix_cuspidata/1803:60-1088(-)